MSEYLLSAHSYVCLTDDYAVFLDLKRDKYTALALADARTLASRVQGWPRSETPTPGQPPTESDSELVQMLLNEGLLTDNAASGKPATPVALEPATTTLAAIPGQFPRIDIGDFRKFVFAWLVTTLVLRLLPLSYVVGRVRRRKERKGPAAAAFDVPKVHRLMMAYCILRPNFFSNVDACLRDSLTFVEFLARYDLYPTLVFGVTMNPFAAHAWVQDGCIVLNDQVVHINHFVPIMAI